MRHSDSAHCPLCYSNRRGRSNYKGHWGYQSKPSLEAADVRSFMRRPAKGDQSGPPSAPRGVDLFFTSYPLLSQRLQDDRWDDGAERVPDTLFLFHDGQRWKVMIKDREAASVAFVSADTLQGLFDALEAGLASSTLDWRADRQTKQRKK